MAELKGFFLVPCNGNPVGEDGNCHEISGILRPINDHQWDIPFLLYSDQQYEVSREATMEVVDQLKDGDVYFHTHPTSHFRNSCAPTHTDLLSQMETILSCNMMSELLYDSLIISADGICKYWFPEDTIHWIRSELIKNYRAFVEKMNDEDQYFFLTENRKELRRMPNALPSPKVVEYELNKQGIRITHMYHWLFRIPRNRLLYDHLQEVFNHAKLIVSAPFFEFEIIKERFSSVSDHVFWDHPEPLLHMRDYAEYMKNVIRHGIGIEIIFVRGKNDSDLTNM